jgi:hypothetical protein
VKKKNGKKAFHKVEVDSFKIKSITFLPPPFRLLELPDYARERIHHTDTHM